MNARNIAISLDPGTLASFDTIVDTRSPAEFNLDRVPGAISCPVLDNEERIRVGTLYKQVSPYKARVLGAALVAKNIARYLESTFAQKEKSWKPLVYCWRGGKRSGAMAHVMREIGWDAKTIEGGYKTYRRYVVDALAARPASYTFRVIHGVTGSGKSRLLRTAAAEGAQVLDLEELAAHRGSLLGALPSRLQPTQKMFESLVLHKLQSFDATKPVYVEGESKKIGQLQIPDALMERMRASECLLLESDTPTRVALLMDEYRHFFTNVAKLGALLDCLVELHGRERIGEWKALAAAGQWPEFVGRLLEEHYDPAYKRSAPNNFPRLPEAKVLRLDSVSDAAFSSLAGKMGSERII